MPNQINGKLDILKNFWVWQIEADKYARRRGCTCRYGFQEGDHFLLKDINSKRWYVKDTIQESKPASDGSGPQSLIIQGKKGGTYMQNAKFIMYDSSADQADKSYPTKSQPSKFIWSAGWTHPVPAVVYDIDVIEISCKFSLEDSFGQQSCALHSQQSPSHMLVENK